MDLRAQQLLSRNKRNMCRLFCSEFLGTYDRYMTLFAVINRRFSIGRIPYHPFDEDGYVLSEVEANKCAFDSPKAFKLLYELGKIKNITCIHFNLVVVNGDMSILTWFRSIGVPWNASSMKYASRSGRIDLVKWLHENGCPSDGRAITYALTYYHIDIVGYLVNNGVIIIPGVKWPQDDIDELADLIVSGAGFRPRTTVWKGVEE